MFFIVSPKETFEMGTMGHYCKMFWYIVTVLVL